MDKKWFTSDGLQITEDADEACSTTEQNRQIAEATLVVDTQPGDLKRLNNMLKPFNLPVLRRVCVAKLGGSVSDYVQVRSLLLQRLAQFVSRFILAPKDHSQLLAAFGHRCCGYRGKDSLQQGYRAESSVKE